jgi:hypothetical protein
MSTGPISGELQQKLTLWRAKCLDGTITIDELREAVQAMRGDRRSAAVASDKSRRAKAKAEIPSADDMLNELGT